MLKRLYHNKGAFLVVLAAFLVLIFFSFTRERTTTNPRSRIITVERLVDAGTWAHRTPLDSTRFTLSEDAISVEGNIYSSKPPVYPFIMAVESKLVTTVFNLPFYDHKRSFIRMLTIVNQVFPYILMLLLFYRWMEDFEVSTWTRTFMMAALSFGLLSFGYAVTINNHTVAAVLLTVSFYLLYRIRYKGLDSLANYLMLGLITGLCISIDWLSVFFIGYLYMMLLTNNPRRGFLSGLVASVPVLLSMYFYYNISGSPLPFQFQGALYNFAGSYWTRAESLDLLREPKHIYFFNMIFGHHGLVVLTPLLILPFISGFKSIKDDRLLLSPMFHGILVVSIITILVIMQFSKNYGGHCIGMRWLIFFSPLLMFSATPMIDRIARRWSGRVILILLLIISFLPNLEALYYEAFIQSRFELWWHSVFG